MKMNDPGTSIFQGAAINYDNLRSREEEEEALEDQKRRDLELKNILENAFDDVSFDNDEGCNITNNHSVNHTRSPSDHGIDILKEVGMSHSQIEFIRNCPEDFNTPLRHSNNVPMKKVDFNCENDTYSDQYRMNQQNGTLHDIVDASGGGGDNPASFHYKHCFKKSPIGDAVQSNGTSDDVNGLNRKYQETSYNSIEQLQLLYEVRVREVHRLTELVDALKNNHEIEKMDWKKQLAIALAEKERSNMSQTQLQNLLVASKQQIEDLEKELNIFKKDITSLTESKDELLSELETSKAAVNDLQRKVTVLEKGNRDKTESMQHENSLRTLTEKHNNDLKHLQNQLDNYVKNYELKSKESDELKLKLTETIRTNDENVMKKSEIINRLSKQMEETQQQCEKLMKGSVIEDNIKLQMEVKILKEENLSLKSKLENLEKQLTNQESELKQYESLSKMSVLDSSNQSDQVDRSDLNAKLRSELYRALNSLKSKRQEINNLHEQLKEKDLKMQETVEKERMFLFESAKFREEASKRISELKSCEEVIKSKILENKRLEKKFNEMKSELEAKLEDAQKKCQELENENETLKSKAINLESNLEKEKMEAMNKYNEEYLRFHNERLQRVTEELEESSRLESLKKDIEIENLKKELEEIKNLYVEVSNAKEIVAKQLEVEKSNSGRSSVDLDEVKRLQKELEKSKQRILELDETVRQQYHQEVEKLNDNIKNLNLEVEKTKKEKEHVSLDKDKIITENELLKTEIEQMTSEKNLYFLNCEKLTKDNDRLTKEIKEMKESLDLTREKHCKEYQELKSKHEIQVKKLNKEIELLMSKNVKTESKYTSPMKTNTCKNSRHVGVQGSPIKHDSKSTSPLMKNATREASTSPISDCKRRSSKDRISVLTEQIPKAEVVSLMEKLGERHEEEIRALENKHRSESIKMERKFQMEVEKVKDGIRSEMTEYHIGEMEKAEEKHRIEMENRIEQEKKEAVVALITEWACEVQALKHSYADAQVEIEQMRKKYKAAKSMALQYKSYFENKAAHMKEEWKRVEDGYEKALKELEKNVRILVDVREDEVKAKVDSITKIYEQQICKLKEKLAKYENRLKNGENVT